MPLNSNQFSLPEYLQKQAVTISYAKRAIISQPGDGFTDRCIVLSGMVKAYDYDNKGNQVAQLLYGPGDLFSPEHLTSAISLELSFQAMADTVMLQVPRKPFFEAARQDAAFSYAILQHVIVQLGFYKMRMDNLAFRHSRERLAFRLLLMAYRFGEVSKHKIALPSVTQEDLAHTINLTRESVSKGLKRLERLGYIKQVNSHVEILDASGLIAEIPGQTRIPPFFRAVEQAIKSD